MADDYFKTGSWKKRDEYYTPPILVKAILPYVNPSHTVWCPFDTKRSEFVKMLEDNGNDVIATHIWNGKDFFEYEPKKDYDVIISNPPFTRKLDVLRRCYDELKSPFALLLGLPVLNYQNVGRFFTEEEHRKLQLLIVDKKVSYDGNTSSFNTSYFCNDVLPRDLMFSHLEHNNSNDDHVKSEMYEEANKRNIDIH